jgi:hypothetical protein
VPQAKAEVNAAPGSSVALKQSGPSVPQAKAEVNPAPGSSVDLAAAGRPLPGSGVEGGIFALLGRIASSAQPSSTPQEHVVRAVPVSSALSSPLSIEEDKSVSDLLATLNAFVQPANNARPEHGSVSTLPPSEKKNESDRSVPKSTEEFAPGISPQSTVGCFTTAAMQDGNSSPSPFTSVNASAPPLSAELQKLESAAVQSTNAERSSAESKPADKPSPGLSSPLNTIGCCGNGRKAEGERVPGLSSQLNQIGCPGHLTAQGGPRSLLSVPPVSPNQVSIPSPLQLVMGRLKKEREEHPKNGANPM